MLKNDISRYHDEHANDSVGIEGDQSEQGCPPSAPVNADKIMTAEGLTLIERGDAPVTHKELDLYVAMFGGMDPCHDILMNRLSRCGPEDHIKLWLNSPGGSVNTGIRLIQTLRCYFMGRITTFVESKAHSMGAAVFLEGNTRIIHPMSSWMLHDYSTMLFGKGGELQDTIDHTDFLFNQLVERPLENGWITETDIQRMKDGKEFYITPKDMAMRGMATDIFVNGRYVPTSEYLRYQQGEDVGTESHNDFEDFDLACAKR